MTKDEQIEALAQKLYEAEKLHTSFNHRLSYHRDVAATLYEQGVRVHKPKYRIDETWTNVHGQRLANRLGERFDTAEEAQHFIDTVVLTYPIAQGRTYTVVPEMIY